MKSKIVNTTKANSIARSDNKRAHKMIRKYESVEVAYASEINADGSANRIFTMIRDHRGVVLVPFGHVSASTLKLSETWDITTSNEAYKTYNISGQLVDIEPIAEFNHPKPKLSECPVFLQLSGSWPSASVTFVDDAGELDTTESVVLAKDLLEHYPETAPSLAKQLEDSLGPTFLYTFEIDEIAQNSRPSTLEESYSPDNYTLNREYCSSNFTESNLFTKVSSIVGPYRPTKQHKFFKMYVADFLSYSSKSDMPDFLTVSTVEDLHEDITMPSLQSRKDFRRLIIHRVQSLPNADSFISQGHYDAILEYSNMNAKKLEQQCNEDYSMYHVNDFWKFRLLISCEAMSVLHGKVLKFDLTKKRKLSSLE